jgi:hypothetical protein
MGLSTFDEKDMFVVQGGLNNASGTGPIAFVGALTRDYRIDSLICVSNDTVDHDVYVYRTFGGVTNILGSTHVPLGSGLTSLPVVELITPTMMGSIGGIFMPIGATLQIQVIVAVSSGKNLYVSAQGGYL